MTTIPDRDTDAHVDKIREHARERVAAFGRGDLDAASAAHGRWYRAYTEAPESVRERYWGTARPDPVARWLESPEGEKWSERHHARAWATQSDLPTHVASVREAPGRTLGHWGGEGAAEARGARPEHDPSGRPPMSRRTRSGRSGR